MTEVSTKVKDIKDAYELLRQRGWIIDEAKGTGYHPDQPTASISVKELVHNVKQYAHTLNPNVKKEVQIDTLMNNIRESSNLRVTGVLGDIIKAQRKHTDHAFKFIGSPGLQSLRTELKDTEIKLASSGEAVVDSLQALARYRPEQIRALSVDGLCDFCSSGKPTKIYPAMSFLMPNKVGSKGSWNACAECATLIDSDNWIGLEERALDSFEADGRMARGERSFMQVTLRETYRRLRDNLLVKPKPKRLVPDSVLFHIQNVRDYYMEHMEKSHHMSSYKMVKLPFERIVFSYDHKFIKLKDTTSTMRHVNVAMREMDVPDFFSFTRSQAQFIEQQVAETMVVVQRINPDTIIEATIHVDGGKLPGNWFVFVDKTGQVLTDEATKLGWLWIRNGRDTQFIMEELPSELRDTLESMVCRHGCIGLTALQFLNCKNVEVLDNPPSRQQRRAAERANQKPPVTYKTLVIHPMSRKRVTVKNPDGSARHGVSLHIVRGHLRDYRQGAGLGRNHAHGLFWCEPHLRGSEEHGRVEKDYEVEPGE